MIVLRKFITLNGNASLYLLYCLSEKSNAQVIRAGDLKVSFNHTL